MPRASSASPFMFMSRGLTSSYPASGGSNGMRTVRDSPLPLSWYVKSMPYTSPSATQHSNLARGTCTGRTVGGDGKGGGQRTLVSMPFIFALETCAVILPQYRTYETSVSGWLDMYMHRKPDLSATGSAPMLSADS